MSEGNLGSHKEKLAEKVTFQHGSEAYVLQDEKQEDGKVREIDEEFLEAHESAWISSGEVGTPTFQQPTPNMDAKRRWTAPVLDMTKMGQGTPATPATRGKGRYNSLQESAREQSGSRLGGHSANMGISRSPPATSLDDVYPSEEKVGSHTPSHAHTQKYLLHELSWLREEFNRKEKEREEERDKEKEKLYKEKEKLRINELETQRLKERLDKLCESLGRASSSTLDGDDWSEADSARMVSSHKVNERETERQADAVREGGYDVTLGSETVRITHEPPIVPIVTKVAVAEPMARAQLTTRDSHPIYPTISVSDPIFSPTNSSTSNNNNNNCSNNNHINVTNIHNNLYEPEEKKVVRSISDLEETLGGVQKKSQVRRGVIAKVLQLLKDTNTKLTGKSTFSGWDAAVKNIADSEAYPRYILDSKAARWQPDMVETEDQERDRKELFQIITGSVDFKALGMDRWGRDSASQCRQNDAQGLYRRLLTAYGPGSRKGDIVSIRNQWTTMNMISTKSTITQFGSQYQKCVNLMRELNLPTNHKDEILTFYLRALTPNFAIKRSELLTKLGNPQYNPSLQDIKDEMELYAAKENLLEYRPTSGQLQVQHSTSSGPVTRSQSKNSRKRANKKAKGGKNGGNTTVPTALQEQIVSIVQSAMQSQIGGKQEKCPYGDSCWQNPCKKYHPPGFKPAPHPKTIKCTKCQRTGHAERDCGRCFTCGSTDHLSRSCPKGKKTKASQNTQAVTPAVSLQFHNSNIRATPALTCGDSRKRMEEDPAVSIVHSKRAKNDHGFY